VVRADRISKRFGSTQALRDVDLTLRKGSCLGLVGRNGAGKSTVVAALCGLWVPDSGRVLFDEKPAPRLSDVRAWRQRIATVFQRSMVVPCLTVTENVFLGDLQTSSQKKVDWQGMRKRTAEIMEEWGFDIDPQANCEDLSVDQRQIVEIARALAMDSPCLLLDEPTAALERKAIDTLFGRVRALVAHGVAVLYISHHLEEVFEICDDVTVMRDGVVIQNAPTSELSKDDLVSIMVGDQGGQNATGGAADGRQSRRHQATGPVRLAVDKLGRESTQGTMREISLTVREGESVGVTGLLSSGVLTLGRALAGMETVDAGSVSVDDRRMRLGDREAAQRAGIGYVPADRAAEGFVPQLGVGENLTMTVMNRLASRLGVVSPAQIAAAAAPMAEQISVVASGLDQPVQELSGGNQQKVVVGRALIHDPSVIVAVCPTRGVDVASKAVLLDALHDESRRTGAALLITTDELDDVLDCDRVIVLVRGEVFARFDQPPFDREQLIAATEGIGRTAHTDIDDGGENG